MEVSTYQITTDLVLKVSVHAIALVAAWLYRRTRLFFERLHPLARPTALAVLALLYCGLNYFVHQQAPSLWTSVFAVSTLAVGWVVFVELQAFWRLGFLGADRMISTGVDYRKSLAMCKDSLEFLGIGASKLIAEREAFFGAVARCHREERPVRFLLCPPDSPQLLEIARRARRPEAEYQETVKKSLMVLSQLKLKESRNIEVRFYDELPLFRLMFVNNSLCLASHYILGEGTGEQLPQLHILRKAPGRRDNESFYYPLHKYFLGIWERAQPWDFQKYL